MASINCPSTLNHTLFCLEPTNYITTLPCGNLIYTSSKTWTIALHVSWTITHTVERATPNKCPMVRYSLHVARHQRVIAIQCSTQIAWRICIFCHSITGLSFHTGNRRLTYLIWSSPANHHQWKFLVRHGSTILVIYTNAHHQYNTIYNYKTLPTLFNPHLSRRRA